MTEFPGDAHAIALDASPAQLLAEAAGVAVTKVGHRIPAGISLAANDHA